MLELFLFTERRAKERDLDKIASSVGLDAQTMRSIERGAQSIDSQPALTIAAWAEALGLQRENVRAASYAVSTLARADTRTPETPSRSSHSSSAGISRKLLPLCPPNNPRALGKSS